MGASRTAAEYTGAAQAGLTTFNVLGGCGGSSETDNSGETETPEPDPPANLFEFVAQNGGRLTSDIALSATFTPAARETFWYEFKADEDGNPKSGLEENRCEGRTPGFVSR